MKSAMKYIIPLFMVFVVLFGLAAFIKESEQSDIHSKEHTSTN